MPDDAEPQSDPTAAAEPSDFAALPPETQAYIRQLRKENAGQRIRLKSLANTESVITEKDRTIRDLKLSNVLLKHGAADPEMIEFFLKKEGQWDDLSPDDGDVLINRVDDLIARRPELRQRAAATRSGSGSERGGPGIQPGSTQLTRSQLATMKPEAVEQALRDGRLNEILGRR